MGSDWNPHRDTPDLTGKVAVVTGANSGIGLYTALHLALHGAKVYLGARTQAKGDHATKTISSLQPTIAKDRLSWLPLDLSKLESVLQAVEHLKGKEQKIDILINNAGIATMDKELTDGGWEMGMGVNHIGHFVLTNGLLPLLKQAATERNADVRVVTVSSSANYLFIPADYQVDFSDPAVLAGKLPYEPWKYRLLQKRMFNVNVLYYGMSKLANVLFARELQRRLDNLGLPITSLSVNPGSVKSDNAVGIFPSFTQPLVKRIMFTLDQGSFNSLFAATATDVWRKPEVYKGKYLEPVGKIHSPNPICLDEKQARALWETTTSEVNKYLSQHGYAPLDDL